MVAIATQRLFRLDQSELMVLYLGYLVLQNSNKADIRYFAHIIVSEKYIKMYDQRCKPEF